MSSAYCVPVDNFPPDREISQSPALIGYANQVKASIPGIRLIPSTFKDTYVYFEGAVHTSGVISYGTYGGGSGAMYCVTADTISNGKFSTGTRQNKMAMSKNIETAIKNVRKYIRPLTIQQDARQGLGALTSAVQQVLNTTARSRHSLTQVWNVERTSRLVMEMRRILASDYKFADQGFRNDLMDWFKYVDLEESINSKTRRFTYVHVTEDHRGAVLRMCRTTQGQGARLYGMNVDGLTTTLPTELVNEEIIGRVSVLSMLENGKYVEGVGYRMGTHTFFVEFDGPFEQPNNAEPQVDEPSSGGSEGAIL